VSVCLDSWAVLAWLHGREPATARVEDLIETRPVISWVNLVEVYYRLERDYGRGSADETLAELRVKLRAEVPRSARMIEAARLKAVSSIALGDCFGLATAAAHGLMFLTVDPEILELEDPPCALEDLRG
jgi:PIN domain nuclease of toxin-antitoxin system